MSDAAAARLLDYIKAAPSAAPALVVVAGEAVTRHSYGELLSEARGWAERFSALGLQRGDTIGVWLANSVAWVAIELAAAWLGLIVIPVNPRLRGADAQALLETAQAKCLIAPRANAAVDMDQLLREAVGSSRMHVVRIGDEASSSTFDTPIVSDDLPLNCFSTSGSTGAPKLALHRQSSVVTRFNAAGERFGIGAGDAMLCVLPLCGVWGLGVTLASLMHGATAVLMATFDANAAARAMAEFRIAHLHGGDNLIREVLAADAFDGGALTHWRTCYFGAFTGRPAEETVALIEACGAPRVKAAQAYGSSEGLAFVAGAHADAPVEERVKAGGPLVDARTRVRVVGADGAAFPIGEAGEIQLAGDCVTEGYLNNPEATARAFTSDDWYTTGDLGYATADGVVFVARMGDALRLRGNLVDPAEIENHLCAHKCVLEAHVVGVRGEAGDVAVAFVWSDGADEAELLAFCRSRIASFKIPQRIIVTDDIPKTIGANGAKVQKHLLRERAQSYLQTPFST